MLKISLTTAGLLDKSTLDAWTRQKQAAIHKAVAAGMQAGGKSVADVVRSKMKTDFTVKKPGCRAYCNPASATWNRRLGRDSAVHGGRF